jgi:ComF family protein
MTNFFQALIKPLSSTLQKVIGGIGNFLLPPRCLNCRQQTLQDNGLCPDCWQQLTPLTLCCQRCALPMAPELAGGAGDLLCGNCLTNPPPFRLTCAALLYDDISAQHVMAFKHGDRLDYAPWFARLLWQVGGQKLLMNADWIIPVPLHWTRQWRRRYNQAAELAKRVGGFSGVAVGHRLLKRRKATKSQGGLGMAARQRNVAHAFQVPPKSKAQLAGKTVVLIDDVFTTGATARACSQVLLRAGAAEVRVLTIARVARSA